MNQSSSSVVLLGDTAVIEISGADAGAFLQGQLTHDIAGLEAGSARLAGYCTAKGRLLGTLVIWRAAHAPTSTFHALIKADIAQAIVKRLSMFVLRAKVVLRIVPMDVLGVSIGATAAAAAQPAPPDSLSTANRAKGSPLDTRRLPAGTTPFAIVQEDSGVWIAAPSADPGVSRWWHIAASNQADLPAASEITSASERPESSVAPAANVPLQGGDADSGPLRIAGNAGNETDGGDADITGQALWQAADIAAGLPWIVAATQDVFIPQTLNLDLIDGISFTKGCYPGQEVVARSHYRGTVKRRMAYGLIRQPTVQNAAELPNVDIFDAQRPASPCGRVINAAGTGTIRLLLEVQLADLGQADFRLRQADGPSIEIASLPYEIKAAG
jgi:folate-binding protein YgfZ